MEERMFVIAKDGTPMMPSRRWKHMKRLVREGKARIIDTHPYTIQLLYETEENVVEDMVLSIDLGRTNIGLGIVSKDTLACHTLCDFTTRNKEVPQNMKERKMHRMASRSGERKVRKRRAKKNNTLFKPSEEQLVKAQALLEEKKTKKKVKKLRKLAKQESDVEKKKCLEDEIVRLTSTLENKSVGDVNVNVNVSVNVNVNVNVDVDNNIDDNANSETSNNLVKSLVEKVLTIASNAKQKLSKRLKKKLDKNIKALQKQEELKNKESESTNKKSTKGKTKTSKQKEVKPLEIVDTSVQVAPNGETYRLRMLPKYQTPVKVKDIKNTEARFCNRKRPDGWLTPTANHLYQSDMNVIHKMMKYAPIKYVALEINKFAFARMENPNIKAWEYQRGKLFGKGGLHNAIDEMQKGQCLLCKNPIEHYHHIVEQCNNGSNTIDNIAGLCTKCHDKVHKDEKAKARLVSKKQGLEKKYGALSVLNQIMPKLIETLYNEFGNKLLLCTGQDTKKIREIMGIEKDHPLDAYAIALAGLYNADLVTMEKIETLSKEKFFLEKSKSCNYYHLIQVRRHCRAIIHAQRERTYYLGKEKIAKNRRKRTGQTEPSLHDWYLETKKTYGKVRAKELQGQVTCKKSTRYYKSGEYFTGDVFIYKGKRYVCSASLTNGTYLRAFGQGDKNFPIKDCKIIKKNTGIVFL